MSTVEIRLVYDDARQASEAYFSGLRHGLATAEVEEAPDEGTQVAIVIDLPYAGEEIRVQGTVVHASAVATVVRLDEVPPELHLLMGSAEGERDAASITVSGSFSDFKITGEQEENLGDADQTLVTVVPPDLGDADGDAADSSRIPSTPEVFGPVSSSARAKAARAPRKREERPTSRTARGPVGRETLEGRIGIPVPFEPGILVPGVPRFRADFAEVSPASLFLRMHVDRLTGVGLILVDDSRYWLYVLDGSPVHYVRDPEDENASTEALLAGHGLLPPAVLEQVQLLAQLTARPLVSVVMRLGLITESQMTTVRRDQARMTTADLLARRNGSLRFFEFPEIRDLFSSSTVPVMELLWHHASEAAAGVARDDTDDRIREMEGHQVTLTDVGKRVLHELPVEGIQREFLNQLTRPTRQVSKLMKRARISTPVAVRLLLALEWMGVISMAGGGEGISALERLFRARLARLEEDHFELLSLHWSALPEEIRAACDAVERELRELEKSGAEIDDFRELRSALLRRTSDIRDLCLDERDLARYVAEISSPDDREMAAEMFLKQGEMALYRNDEPQASASFRRVLAVDPGLPSGTSRRERTEQALKALRG